jgi:DNA-binding transcriptional MerR regulator
MDHKPLQESWLTAAECARRIGLSVRALRVYEAHGLITPRRTDKSWRLYGAGEIARLNEVLALKSLGLSLSHIAELLKGRATDLRQLLEMQREALNQARLRTERGLATIDAMHAKLVAGVAVSIDDLVELAKESNMSDVSHDAVAWRRYEQARPRTEVAVDKAVYAEYAGAYELDGGGTYYVVTAKDGKLFTRVIGQPDIEIFPEGETEFFMKVLPVQVTFIRDADGKVNNLVHHQGGAEARGVRVDAEVAAKAEADLERRKREKLPQPDSEQMLRVVIANSLRGEPDYEMMSPLLAALAREQHDLVIAELKSVGSLRSLTFRGVGQSGVDVYDARFDNAEMEWGIFIGRNGKISTLYFRKLP